MLRVVVQFVLIAVFLFCWVMCVLAFLKSTHHGIARLRQGDVLWWERDEVGQRFRRRFFLYWVTGLLAMLLIVLLVPWW